MNTTYIIVPAPGHYGDRASVLSSHRTLDAARRKRGNDRSVVIRTGTGTERKGSRWLRVYEEFRPVVE